MARTGSNKTKSNILLSEIQHQRRKATEKRRRDERKAQTGGQEADDIQRHAKDAAAGDGDGDGCHGGGARGCGLACGLAVDLMLWSWRAADVGFMYDGPMRCDAMRWIDERTRETKQNETKRSACLPSFNPTLRWRCDAMKSFKISLLRGFRRR